MNGLQFVVLAAPGADGSTRRRTYTLVCEFPGLHQGEIARQLGVTPPAAEHHLRNLVRAGLLTAERNPGATIYFPAVQGANPTHSVPPLDKKKVAIFRQRKPLEILGVLLLHESMPMQELAQFIGVGAPTVTHHVAKLERAELVERRNEGRTRIVHLKDRDALVELLLTYEPPQDLLSGFEDLWSEIGLSQ